MIFEDVDLFPTPHEQLQQGFEDTRGAIETYIADRDFADPISKYTSALQRRKQMHAECKHFDEALKDFKELLVKLWKDATECTSQV